MASGGAMESGIASASAASSPPSIPSDPIDEATPRLKNAWSQIVRGPSSPARSKAEPPPCSPQSEEQNERLYPDGHSRVSESLIKEDPPSDTIATAVKASSISSSDGIRSPGVEKKQFSGDMLSELPIASPDKLIKESELVESRPTQQSPVKSPKLVWGKLAANVGSNPEPEPVMGAVAWPALSEARNTKVFEQSKCSTATQKPVPKTSSPLSNDQHQSQAPPLLNREVGGNNQTMPTIVNRKAFNQVTGNGNNVSESILTSTASPSKGVHGGDGDQLRRGGGKEIRSGAASEVHQRGNTATSQVSSHESARSLMWDQGRGNHSFPAYGRGYTSPRDSNVPVHHQRGGHRNVPQQPLFPFVAPNPAFVHPAGFQNVPGGMYYIPAPVSEPVLGATYFVPPPVQGVLMHGPDPATLQGLVVKQIEYYFSIENLCRDIYLRSKMDEQGFVPVSVIAKFNRVRMITQNPFLIIEALRMSNVVEVQGDKVRKKDDWAKWILPANQQSAASPTPVGEGDQINQLMRPSLKAEGYDYQTNGEGPSNEVGEEPSMADLVSELTVQNVVEGSPSQPEDGSCDDGRIGISSVEEEEVETNRFTQGCSIESGHRID